MSNPKYIRIFSDIHLDFDIPSSTKNFDPSRDIWSPTPMPTDQETILILAGDIWHAKKPFSFMGFSWFKKISAQFHSIIVLLGNHDFWGGNLQKEYEHYRKNIAAQNLTNVQLLQNSTIILGDIKFVGGTLWTDYNQGNLHSIAFAETYMNDFKYIRNGLAFSKLKANHLIGEHLKTARYIEENAKRDFPEQNLWVITHHLPTFRSIPLEYEGYDINENALYASNLEHLFTDDINVWVHGHSHHAINYTVKNTRIISNPRGYRLEETNYDETYLFDLAGNLI